MDVIRPDWPAPPRVKALVTTRACGDMSRPEIRARLRGLVPGEPAWLKQVHGTGVLDLDEKPIAMEGDASVTRVPGAVCVVGAADCMPVLLADEAGSVVAAAHAGWRGMASGVIESTAGSDEGARGEHSRLARPGNRAACLRSRRRRPRGARLL